jgi:RNA polymerase sigma-70 factor (ECF subfamily)
VDDAVVGELMGRYSRGEDCVFNDLYSAIAGRLYRFCMRLAGRRGDADDLFQETFLRIHRARATYLLGAKFWPWMYAIARAVHIDSLRYRRRHPEELGASDDVGAQDLPRVARGADGPEAAAQAHALVDVVSRELDRMSEKNRTAYVLLREEELSVREAALVLGTTVDVVKQRAHRAYRLLRAALDAAGWREGVDETWDTIPVRA